MVPPGFSDSVIDLVMIAEGRGARATAPHRATDHRPTERANAGLAQPWRRATLATPLQGIRSVSTPQLTVTARAALVPTLRRVLPIVWSSEPA